MTNKEDKIDWKEQFQKLVNMASILDYKVVMSDVDQCHYNLNKILINKNRTPQNRVYVLSHELGHVNLRRKYSTKEYLRQFPGSMYSGDSKIKRVSDIEEEVLAWDEAKKILTSLDIPINDINFNRVKTACLGTYI